jgi:hypothetical protein
MTQSQPILSRLFEADGTPRERALWLVLAGIVSSLLLAFFVVCVHQVERAQARHAQVQQAATQGCVEATGLAAACSSRTADATSPQMGTRVR